MLLSTAAHQQAGELITRKLRKAYQAGVIARELARLNANYFPKAISIVETDEPEIAGQFVLREGKHLTEELAIDYWNKAGDLLHASFSPVPQERILDGFAQAHEFLNLATSLFKMFEIDVSGNGMWIGGQLNFDESHGPELFNANSAE